MVKISIVRTILSMVVTHGWSIKQLDILNAFLNVNLHKTLYMKQPKGFQDKARPEDVCLLQKALYGLK